MSVPAIEYHGFRELEKANSRAEVLIDWVLRWPGEKTFFLPDSNKVLAKIRGSQFDPNFLDYDHLMMESLYDLINEQDGPRKRLQVLHAASPDVLPLQVEVVDFFVGHGYWSEAQELARPGLDFISDDEWMFDEWTEDMKAQNPLGYASHLAQKALKDGQSSLTC